MKQQISWFVELTPRRGQLENFQSLTGEMVTSTSRELGVLAYRRFISGDQRTVYVYERYESCEAAMSHLQNFAARFGQRYASLVERRRFLVVGEPSDELRLLLDQYEATYLRPFGAFSYWG
jgi:quinol monooxygenase YgiN